MTPSPPPALLSLVLHLEGQDHDKSVLFTTSWALVWHTVLLCILKTSDREVKIILWSLKFTILVFYFAGI